MKQQCDLYNKILSLAKWLRNEMTYMKSFHLSIMKWQQYEMTCEIKFVRSPAEFVF